MTRRPGRRPARAPANRVVPILVLGLAAEHVGAQDAPLEQRWTELQGELATEKRSAQRCILINQFLSDAEVEQHPSHHVVLTARSALGAEYLRARRLGPATTEFEEIRRRCERDSPWGLDLFGFATIGLAQASESDGRTLDAKQLYREVKLRCPATRYADWADLGLARLETKAPEVGEQLPELNTLKDLSDQSHRVRDLRGGPAVLLFLAGPEQDARRRAILAALRAAGIESARLWTFTERPLPMAPEEEPLGDRVFPSESGLLSDIALRCRIQATPTWLVLGPDGRLVARNPSPRRLLDLLRTLGRGGDERGG